MNSARLALLVLGTLAFVSSESADIVKKLSGIGAPASEQEVLFGSSPVSDKQQMLRVYRERLERRTAKEKEQAEKNRQDMAALQRDINGAKQSIAARGTGDASLYLDEKLALLNERYQLLVDAQQLRTKIIDILNQIISLLEDYVKNPSFKGVRVQFQAGYQWSAFLELSKQVLSLEEGLQQTRAERKSLEESLEDLQKDLTQLDKKLKDKEKEQKDFSSGTVEPAGKLTTQEQAELLDQRKSILEAQKNVVKHKIVLTTLKQEFTALRVFIAEAQLDLFKADIEDVSQRLIIDDTVIQSAEKELAIKKRESSEQQAIISQKIGDLNIKQEKLKNEYDALVKRFDADVPDSRLLAEWSFDVKIPNVNLLLYLVALKKLEITSNERAISDLEAQRDLTRAQTRSQELLVQVFNTWYKIMERRVSTEELRNQDLKEFELKKSEIRRDLTANKDKLTALAAQVNSDTRALTNLNDKIEEFKKNQQAAERTLGISGYAQGLDVLGKARKRINTQIMLTTNLTKTYGTISTVLSEDLKQIDLVLGKLERIGGIWQRSAQAISFENVMKVIVPDFKEFLGDLKNIIYRMNFSSLMFTINLLIQYPGILLRLLLLIIGMLALFFALYLYLPRFSRILQIVQEPVTRWGATRNLMSTLVIFTRKHLFGIWLWAFLLMLLKFNVGIAVGFNFTVIFYLLSIPYLSYLVFMFIRTCTRFNEENAYIFVSEIFQRRLQWVLFLFAVATISLVFFREAFLMVSFGKTELPTFLTRIYGVIARILLICLLIKEEVIGIIPSRSKFWLWLRGFVSTYYYVLLAILLALILLWDPHIGGYNKLVYYMVSSSLGTILLLAVLWYLQSMLKRVSAYFFFTHERGEKPKERFSSAATWYGIFIVATLITLGVAGFYFGSKIWGRPISLSKIIDTINLTIMRIKVYDDTGQQINYLPITVGKLLQLALYVVVGVFAARTFERFVIKRIFNLLLVDSAVENTVSRLSVMCFVIVSFLVGLSAIGFGQDHIYAVVIAILLGVVWSLRELVADFLAYFIILLERSVKIGDFIRLGSKDKELSGVVRKITPRAVVLRKKNSMNIVVPNHQVANESIFNWNYTRGFFAFDDIEITVVYSADPQRVKDTLLQVLEDDRNVLKSPHPIVRFTKFTDEGMQFIVRGFLSTINVLNQWEIASDIRIKVVQALRTEGISIAYPVRIVKMVGQSQKNQLPVEDDV